MLCHFIFFFNVNDSFARKVTMVWIFFIGKYGKDKPDHKASQTGEALPLANPNNLQDRTQEKRQYISVSFGEKIQFVYTEFS